MTFVSDIPLLPPTASTFAERVDVLVWFLTGVSALLVFTVFALVAGFGVRYRRRHDNDIPAASTSRPLVEIGGALFLLALFMVIFIWGAVLYMDSRRAPTENVLDISVIGKQWIWQTQHPAGQREINELHVPLGRLVRLTMTSQDVIHSFGVPAFRIKQDVVPGMYTTQWFTATKTGAFRLFCQEYCGDDHSQMNGHVIVMEPKDYAAWLAGVPADDQPAAAGAKLYVSYGCVQCHGSNGPSLAGVYGRLESFSDGSTAVADENYLRESILEPSRKLVAGYSTLMPSYRGQLNEEQLIDLVAYIKSLCGAQSSDSGIDSVRKPAERPPAAGGTR